MQNNTSFIFLFILFFNYAYSQNSAPLFENVNSRVNLKKKQLQITYDLFDREEDLVEVKMELKTKGTYLDTEDIRGDLGKSIRTGKKKKIVWDFENKAQIEQLEIVLVADDQYRVTIEELLSQVSRSNLEDHVEFLASGMRNHNKENVEFLERCRTYISDKLSGFKLDLRIKDSIISNEKLNIHIPEMYHEEPVSSDSILLHVKNLSGFNADYKSNQLFLLTAHYDAVQNSPGADDNATGVAGMLEVARILSQYSFDHAIGFVAFDLEEAGYLGSKMFIYGNGWPKEMEIKGVLNYDMIGYADSRPNTQIIPEGFDVLFPEAIEKVQKNENRGDFTILTANENSANLALDFQDVTSSYVSDLKTIALIIPGSGMGSGLLAASDHSMFWMNDIPAIHIGDGALTRNNNYHGPGDKAESINFDFMTKVVKATIALLAESAKIGHSSTYVIKLP